MARGRHPAVTHTVAVCVGFLVAWTLLQSTSTGTLMCVTQDLRAKTQADPLPQASAAPTPPQSAPRSELSAAYQPGPGLVTCNSTGGRVVLAPAIRRAGWLAQSGEDHHAYKTYFFNKCGGTVLEIGARTGKELSTTHGFVHDLDWRAIHIEANPTSYKALVVNRPESLNIHSAVCNVRRTVHFAEGSDPSISGIVEFMSPKFLKKWHPALAKDPRKVAKLPVVNCHPLQSVLDSYRIRHVDFWVLDVEGAEAEVLSSIDFNRTSIDVIVVEADGSNKDKETAIQIQLSAAGFVEQGRDPSRRNAWYAHRRFRPSAAASS